MDRALAEKIRKEIDSLAPTMEEAEIGHISAVGDGVVEIEGLNNAMMAEMVSFEDVHASVEDAITKKASLYGLVLNLEEETVKAVVLGDSAKLKEGMIVRRSKQVLSIPVGEELIARVVNPLSEPLDGKGPITSNATAPIEREAYGVIDRKSVDTPLATGIKAIDAMVPIGRGQRELIIGDRFTGKTTIAIDTILNQRHEPAESRPICIYVAIGQKESKTARIVAELAERGAMEYTIVVSAPASAPAALQFLAPFAGATIGEYFMDNGKDALIIYDDLSKQAVAYRQLSLLLRRPPGREAYPGDIFYLHSRLLERAAKLSDAKGGGSLTALPIIETQEGDVSAYIPTNVISITDGQIYLEANLFNKGVKPAINVGLSVSRVGSAAQTKAMKKVAGKLRLELAQFRELEAFMQFAQDLDEATKARIESGERLAASLTQGKNAPLPFEEQVVTLFAATQGYLKEVAVSDVARFEKESIDYLKAHHAGLITTIREEKDLSDSSAEGLSQALTTFLKSYSGGDE